MRRLIAISLAITIAAVAAPALADVATGLEQFKAGDYKAAGESFSAAAEKNPDDKRIEFDKACALAAGKQFDEAVEAFRNASLAEDPKLVAMCHYNMGCIDVERAQAMLGEDPAALEPAKRQEVLAMLETAIVHFRDCTATDPEHADAQYNIDGVRLWIARMTDVWRRRDRDAEREKLQLLEYLKKLDGQQRELRATGKALDAAPKSVDRYQKLHDTSKSQRELSDEIEPLKAKILAALQPQQQPGMPQQPSAQPQPAGQPDPAKAAEILGGLADNAGKAMLAAADELAHYKPADAAQTQKEAVEKLDQVFMAAAPYQQLVQHAIDRQQSVMTPQSPAEAVEEDETTEPVAVDFGDAAWNQGFISGYSEVIQAKARQGLAAMPPAPEPKPEEEKPADRPEEAAPGEQSTQPDPAEAAQKKQEALRKAMQNAVEFGPKVTALAIEAAGDLEDGKPEQALPKQQEALKLLKEMLPKDEQQQNQDQNKQDQQNQDQQNQDQDKQDKDKQEQDKQDKDKQDQNKDENKDDKKKDDEKKDPGKDKEDKKDEDKKDQGDKDKKDQEKKDQDNQQQPQPKQGEDQQAQAKKIAMQQAEAVLHRAERRQKERREKEKAIELRLYRPGKVEKDW